MPVLKVFFVPVLLSGFIAMSLNLTVLLVAEFVFGIKLILAGPDGNYPVDYSRMIPESFLISIFAAGVYYFLIKVQLEIKYFYFLLGLIYAVSLHGPLTDPEDSKVKFLLVFTHSTIAGSIGLVFYQFRNSLRMAK